MGNRGVITTEYNFKTNGIGIYLHWNGGRDSVTAFLKYCEMQGYRAPDTDNYGWARLCQVIGNFFGGTLSVGIDTVNRLDCDNGDNGVYIIRGWKIVGREYQQKGEQNYFPLTEMLIDIDKSMPKSEQFGADYIKAAPIAPDEMTVGDLIGLKYDNIIMRIRVVGKVKKGEDYGMPYGYHRGQKFILRPNWKEYRLIEEDNKATA